MASLQQHGKGTATIAALEQLAQDIDNDYNSAVVALNLAEQQWEIFMVGMFNQFFNILEDGKTLASKLTKEQVDYMQILRNSWSELEFDINSIYILNSTPAIVKKFQEWGLIEFRPYKGEEILIIGCGNSPLADCGGYPFHFWGNGQTFSENERDRIEYQSLHEHKGCYTINPAPAYNPSVVGMFSYQTFPNIPDGKFEKIVIEGVLLDDTPTYRAELLRLLKEGGIVVNREGSATSIFNKQDGKIVGRGQLPRLPTHLCPHPHPPLYPNPDPDPEPLTLTLPFTLTLSPPPSPSPSPSPTLHAS
jgi:hypothetical protein